MKAGGWSIARVAGTSVLRLASNLVMTRLLLPEAFGLIAMVNTLIIGFTLFTDIGIRRSIAREPNGDDPHFLRVAWVVKAGRGAVISAGVLVCAVILYFAGPAFAAPESVYADPRLPWMIALSALVPLAMGLESTTRELAERNLEMRSILYLEIGGQIASILAMICFALIHPSVWALMAGLLVGSFAKSAATHIFFGGPRMAFVWDKAIADRLWDYGKWLMGSSIFTFVSQNGDRFILGALLDVKLFGIYMISQIWIVAGRSIINSLSDRVGFPAIAEMVRTRPQELPRLFRRFQMVIDLICVTAFAAAYFASTFMIDLLYTEDYQAAGSYMTLLSISFLTLRFKTFNSLIVLSLIHISEPTRPY